jgi:hypothetical protein
VKKFYADAVVVIKHTERLRAAEGDFQCLARNATLLFHAKTTFSRVEIMPKKALFQRRRKAWETLDRETQSHLQKFGND